MTSYIQLHPPDLDLNRTKQLRTPEASLPSARYAARRFFRYSLTIVRRRRTQRQPAAGNPLRMMYVSTTLVTRENRYYCRRCDVCGRTGGRLQLRRVAVAAGGARSSSSSSLPKLQAHAIGLERRQKNATLCLRTGRTGTAIFRMCRSDGEEISASITMPVCRKD